MNTALWIVQGFLALVFTYSAIVKGTWDRDRLVKSGWCRARRPPPHARERNLREGCSDHAPGVRLPPIPASVAREPMARAGSSPAPPGSIAGTEYVIDGGTVSTV